MEPSIRPPPPIPSDPALAIRWLAWLRRTFIAAQGLLILFIEVGSEMHVRASALVALAAFVVFDVILALGRRWRSPPPSALRVLPPVDLAGTALILGLAGGPDNPLQTFLLAYVALLAIILRKRDAWLATLTILALETAVVFLAPALPGASMLRDEFPGHFVGHVVAFGIAAIAINGFVGRLAEGLRRREAAEKEALVQRAITERLAALGSLAAGVVHELGTPLGAIQLLVEECREGIDNRDAIEAQLGRCRTLLERLRTGESQTGISTPMDLDAWVAEWRRAHPGIEVACGEAVASPLVVGSEDGWRAALWTLLDNAVRARARRVQVALRIGEDVEVSVEDDGEGLAPGMETHAGEPFRSGWGGTGLGLHVARSFARSVGGDVLLETRPGSGARAILKMRRGKS